MNARAGGAAGGGSAKVRLRVTVRADIEYDADPADYGTDDPDAMAAIDRQNWLDDPTMFWATFEDDQIHIDVTPAHAGSVSGAPPASRADQDRVL